jgi:solute:Na+ symporter, SSS family
MQPTPYPRKTKSQAPSAGAFFLISLSLMLAVLAPSAAHASGPEPAAKAEAQRFEIANRNAAPLDAFLDGGFATAHKDVLVVGARAASGDSALAVWTLRMNGKDAWKQSSASMPVWTAAARHGDALLCAGGMVDGLPTRRAGKLIVNGDQLSMENLPDLPMPLAGAGAAVIGGKLLVFGGLSSIDPPMLENTLWTLDLNQAGAQWNREAPLPGPGRAFAAVTSQYDALCVFGGLVAGDDGEPAATREAWLFRLKPPEASLDAGWKRVTDLARPSVAGTAFPVGSAAVVLAGGSESAPSGWIPAAGDSGSGGKPSLYHTITNAWCDFDQPLEFESLLAPLQETTGSPKFLILGTARGTDQAGLHDFRIVSSSHSLSWIDYLVIGIYFLLIASVGVISSRHHKSSAEFSLAGRNVPWWVAGISMFATGASAISFMAIPALAFSTNLVFLFPILIYVIAFYVQSRLIFPLLRRMEITSTYEYLERRFNRTLRLIASAQCIIFQTFGRASVVLLLPSLAISATTGINVYLSVVVMWLITTIYTYAGGFRAVVYTDVFQGLLMFFAPIFIIGVCIFTIPGGPTEFINIGLANNKFDFALLTWDPTLPAVWILLTATFMAGTIVQAGDQPTIQRVFSSPAKEVRRVAAMSVACGILISVVTNVLGIAIFGYFHAFPAKLDPLAQTDKIVPLFVIQTLPPGFVGMVIAAIFAAAMTTIASSMNSSATVFTEDFYLRFKPKANDRQRLIVLRVASTVVGLIGLGIALFLATMNLKSIMVTWTIICALLGGGIVGVYSLGMFTRHANGFGAVAGVITSILVTAWVKFYTPLHWQTLIPIAILSCMLSGYLFSFLSRHHKDLAGLTIYTPKKTPADDA